MVASPSRSQSCVDTYELTVEREELFKELHASLNEDDGVGIVVVGPAGIGKTTAINHLALKLLDHWNVVKIRGSLYGSSLEFGALGFLISDLEDRLLENPVCTMRGLADAVEAQAVGKQTVFVVDNAHLLDPLSAMVLGYLALAKTAKLVLACPDLIAAPDEFKALWRTGRLARCDLQPMSYAESAQLLTAELDGPLSAEAAYMLHATSGGNPLHLLLLGRDCVASGGLIRRDGIWVATGEDLFLGRQSIGAITSCVLELPGEQREILDVLAVCGSIPLRSLRTFIEPTTLDILQELSLIEVRAGAVPTVAVTNSMLSGALRSSLSESRRQELAARFDDDKSASTDSGTVSLLRSQPKSLLRVRAIALRGKYTTAAPGFDDIRATEDTCIESRWLATAGLAEALMATGKLLDAFEVGRKLEDALAIASDGVREEISARLMPLQLISGGLQNQEHRRSGYRYPISPLSASRSDLEQGLRLALDGDGFGALAVLVPLVRQLELRDTLQARSLAASAAAYCAVLNGESDRAAQFSFLSRQPAPGTSWAAARLANHFTAMTMAARGHIDTAVQMLRAAALEDNRLGNIAYEVLALSRALRLNALEVIPRLLIASASCQGPTAKLCEQYAKGMDNMDIHTVLEAMDTARDMGDTMFARDIAHSARRLAAGDANARAMRYVRRRTRPVLIGDVQPAPGCRRLDCLTAQEIEVVLRLAGGASNKLIAEDLELSVRTVEGHLFQVYNKLQVRKRSELVEIIADSLEKAG